MKEATKRALKAYELIAHHIALRSSAELFKIDLMEIFDQPNKALQDPYLNFLAGYKLKLKQVDQEPKKINPANNPLLTGPNAWPLD